jgi:thymidylate kinase
MPIIIVEGVDGAGKSTFIEMIKNEIPDRYSPTLWHCGPIQHTAEEEYYLPLLEIAEDDFMVSDRWHVGEMIYGPLYRSESKVEGEWKDKIEKLLDDLGAIKVIMKPSLEEVKKRLAHRGEDYLQDEHVEEVYNFYAKYAEENQYHVVKEATLPTLKYVARELVGLAILGAK